MQGKQVYREVCDNNLPWDVELKGAIKKRWEKWEDNLPSEVAVPRPIAPFQEPVEKLEIHGFGDASGEGLCSGVQPSGVTRVTCCESKTCEERTDHTKVRTCCMPHGNQFGQQYKQSSLSYSTREALLVR